MQEASRLQYLALLGIEQWLPRDAVDTAENPAPVEVPEALPVAAERPAPASAHVSAPAPASAATRERLDALLTRSPTAAANPANDATPVAPALPPVAQAASSPAPAAAAERIGCAFLVAGDGLLLVAHFVSPAAPGLGSAEHAMFVRLAGALVPGAALPEPANFTWPPAGVRLPGMDKPGAGAEALRALIGRHQRDGARDVVVLGEASLVASVAEAAGLRVVVAPSLAAMLAEPARKRECWDLIAPLKRGPGA